MEACMRKPLLILGSAVCAGILSSSALAACFDGHVTASKPSEQEVAMSTHEGSTATIATEQKADTQAATACAEGDKDCTPAKE
jgi:hypothetical protein